MNVFSAIGRLTKDIELKQTANGKYYTRFTLAIRRDKENADFINCVAWNKTAEMIADFCEKGQQIGINGELRSGSYEDNNKNKVYTTDCWVKSMYLLGNKNDNTTQKTTNATSNNYNNSDEIDEDEFPF